jgi:hypothetical protein
MPLRQYQRMLSAERQAAYWLHLGNLASERGNKELAERHYARSQKWHDRMNKDLGDA